MDRGVRWLVAAGFLLYAVVAALIFAFLTVTPSHPMLKPVKDMALFALFLLAVVLVFSAVALALEARR